MHKRWNFLRFIRTVVAEVDGGGSDSGEDRSDSVKPDVEDPKPEDNESLGENGMKALKAEREANKAAKARIAEYEAKIKAFEDKNKTESEKEAERIQALEKSNAENSRKALQYEVAAEKGIPLKLATRLRGDERDAMLNDADELLPLIHNEMKPTTPKPDRSQGHGGTPKPTSLSAAIAGHLK